MRVRFISWVAATSAWLWTLAVEAQTVGSRGAPAFDEGMTKGLVPLFLFVAAGVGVMTIAAIVAVLFLRPKLPASLRGA